MITCHVYLKIRFILNAESPGYVDICTNSLHKGLQKRYLLTFLPWYKETMFIKILQEGPYFVWIKYEGNFNIYNKVWHE